MFARRIGISACGLAALSILATAGHASRQEEVVPRRAPFARPLAMVLPVVSQETENADRWGRALARSATYYLSASRRLALHASSDGALDSAALKKAGVDILFRSTYEVRGSRALISLQIEDLRAGDHFDAGEVEGLVAAPGQIAFNIARAWMRAAAEEELTPPLLDAEEGRELELRFRASREPFELYAQGLEAEMQTPGLALSYYRRALALEPFFLEARDRAVLTALRIEPSPLRMQRALNRDMQMQLRSGRRDLAHYAAQLIELAQK